MSDPLIAEAERKMNGAIEVLLNEFKGVRTGRANPALLENLKVDYYGTPTPLKQVASITTPDPRTLVIKPFDASVLGGIEKAIQTSDLNLTPQNDGKLLRIAIPPLSGERRAQLAEHVKKLGENAKVSIRNVRRDAKKSIDDRAKEKKISEDQKFRLTEQLDKITKDHEKRVDELVEKKTREVMEQ